MFTKKNIELSAAVHELSCWQRNKNTRDRNNTVVAVSEGRHM